jgi:acyl carrier protein
MKTEEQYKNELREWVLKNSTKVTAEELTSATPLIETRIITSMQVMELILFLEKIKGSRLVIKNIKPGAFKNIDSIYDAFLRTV